MDAPRALIFICIFFLLGISLGTFNVAALFFVILILSAVGSMVMGQKKLAIGIILALCVGFILGNIQFTKVEEFRSINGKLIKERMIVSDVLSTGSSNRYLAKGNDHRFEIFTKMNLNTGQWIDLEGKVQIDEEPWDRYGFSQDKIGTILFPRISINEEHPEPPGIFQNIKNSIEKVYRENLSPDSAGLAAGLFLGEKKELSKQLKDSLIKTGTIHIVVLSGYNITILIAFVSKLFRFLRLRQRMIISLIFIVLFLFLVGFTPSIVRAAIMGSVLVIEPLFGRKRAQMSVLVAAAAAMSLINPLLLTSDPGFQLSFLATIGIILFEARLNKLFSKLPSLFRGALSTSIAAQVLVLPALAYYFGAFSVASPIVNMLVLPTIPIAMAISALLILVLVFPWLSLLISPAAEAILSIPIALIESAGKVAPSITLSMTSAILLSAGLTFIISRIKLNGEVNAA